MISVIIIHRSLPIDNIEDQLESVILHSGGKKRIARAGTYCPMNSKTCYSRMQKEVQTILLSTISKLWKL